MSQRPYQRMLLGVSASIGVLDVHRYLMTFLERLADEVRVVMTPRAAQMVKPELLSAVTRTRVYVDLYDGIPDFPAPHINLPEWAEVFAVLPASADLMARAANGIADDLLTTCILAARTPVVFFPNMNAMMWQNPATHRNVELLRQYGHMVPEPTGTAFEVATGQLVKGSMAPPREAAEILTGLRPLSRKDATA